MEQMMRTGSKGIDIAVLFICFNRIGPSEQVFEAIRKVRPSRLYFACDGPRSEEERPRCEEVRALVDRVDWPCQLRTRFNERNMGLRLGVSSAINWFFEHEPEGIVLEDDTLPVPSFFGYCKELLERYREDERIWVIMGNDLMDEWEGERDGSYWFSCHGYGAPWGWASWRRVWRHYDVTMAQWPDLKGSTLLKDFFLSRVEEHDVHHIFDEVHAGRMNAWSYQLDITRIIGHGLNILPNTNLIRNIGFGMDSTNTMDLADPRNKDTARDIDLPLAHPRFIMHDVRRDRTYYERYIGSDRKDRLKMAVKGLLPGGPDGPVIRGLRRLKKGPQR